MQKPLIRPVTAAAVAQDPNLNHLDWDVEEIPENAQAMIWGDWLYAYHQGQVWALSFWDGGLFVADAKSHEQGWQPIER